MIETSTILAGLVWGAIAIMFAVAEWADRPETRESIVGVR